MLMSRIKSDGCSFLMTLTVQKLDKLIILATLFLFQIQYLANKSPV